MKYIIKAQNIWEQGPREKQEDSIFPELNKNKESDRLFILCDGMGGHSAGEIASRTVCEAMSSYILSNCNDPEGEFTDECFLDALKMAFDALDTKDNGAEKKMGTTLTFLKLHDKGCTIAHIGDSRVYHIRPGRSVEETEILFQTVDHSLVNDLIRVGELTPEEAKHSKQKNVITRAMQPCMEHRSKADIYHSSDIKAGDYFLLCSDGILEQMEDDNLKYIFSEKGGDIQNKVNIIIKATSQNHDNHSAHLIRIEEVIDPIEGLVAPENHQSPEPIIAEVEDDESPEEKEIISEDFESFDNNDNNDSDNRHSKLIWIIVATTVLILGGYFAYNKFITEKDVKQPEEVVIKSETPEPGTPKTSETEQPPHLINQPDKPRVKLGEVEEIGETAREQIDNPSQESQNGADTSVKPSNSTEKEKPASASSSNLSQQTPETIQNSSPGMGEVVEVEIHEEHEEVAVREDNDKFNVDDDTERFKNWLKEEIKDFDVPNNGRGNYSFKVSFTVEKSGQISANSINLEILNSPTSATNGTQVDLKREIKEILLNSSKELMWEKPLDKKKLSLELDFEL